MKRLVVVAGCAALAACIEFGTEYDRRARQLDGGSVGGDGGAALDGGGAVQDGGTADAGPSALPGWADCDASICTTPMMLWGASVAYGQFGGPRGVTVFGDDGPAYIGWLDGGSWSTRELDPLAAGTWVRNLNAVVARTPADYFLVSKRTLGHYENDQPGAYDDDFCGTTPSVGFWTSELTTGTSVSKDEAWFAGTNEGLCHWTRDGGFQTAQQAAGGRSFSAAVTTATGEVWLGADDGYVYSLDGGAMDIGLGAVKVNALARQGDTLWATAENGAPASLARYTPGDGWQPVTDVKDSVRAIWAPAGNDVWVGGYQGKLWHFDGTTWKKVSVPGLENGHYIHTLSGSGRVVLVGGRYDDGSFHGFALGFTVH